MSTQAQAAANRANAELSTGPRTEVGKAVSSCNRITHGLACDRTALSLLPHESAEAYSELLLEFQREHRPETHTEKLLVERMARHHWLRDRAEWLETGCFQEDGSLDEKRLALYMRYRTSHERAFHKCLAELLKLRNEKRKAEIGFESQKRRQEEHTRKQEKHEMAKERHKWDLLLTEAKIDHENRSGSY
jgi:hypothetical protein